MDGRGRWFAVLALLWPGVATRAAEIDFMPWQRCAATLMGYHGPLWNVAYYPRAHPDHLGYATIDAEGYASVWAPPEKPWVQLHEACHVIQFARGDVFPTGHGSPAQEAECRSVQQHWRACGGLTH